MVLSTLDDVFCTWWCFLHLMVFSTLDSVFYTWWCFPHLMVFSTLDGVFCTWWFFYTWWCFLHLMVFSTLNGVFCTWWCFLHLIVFSTLGVFCSWWCVLHLMVFSALVGVFYTWCFYTWCFLHLVFFALDGVFRTWCFLHLRLITHKASERQFLCSASAAIQDSAAPPSVRGLCHSAARSYLRCLMSETLTTWNRADPIFNTWCLVLTNQSKRWGNYSGLISKHQNSPISMRRII